MKLFIVFSALWAAASAVPTFLGGAPAYFTEAIPARAHFVAQDAVGEYSFGYSGKSAAKTETKSFDGVTRGAYSYVDADGKLQSVEYTADAVNGFRAAATNLPTSPVDTGMAPEPVQDTDEVAQARAEHLAAFKEAEIRAAAAPEEPEEEAEETTEENADDFGDQGASAGQAPASTSVAAPGSIHVTAPIATIHSAPTITAIHTAPTLAAIHAAPAVAVRTLEAPASSYAYQVEANILPSYSYTVGTPALYAAPVNAVRNVAYSGTPLIARSHVDLVADRHFGLNGHHATF